MRYYTSSALLSPCRVVDGSLRGDTMTRPDQIRALNDKVKKSFGEPDSWDITAIGQLADSGMMEAMDINTLKKINPENVCAPWNYANAMKVVDLIRICQPIRTQVNVSFRLIS
jgi:hypothetical protein